MLNQAFLCMINVGMVWYSDILKSQTLLEQAFLWNAQGQVAHENQPLYLAQLNVASSEKTPPN